MKLTNTSAAELESSIRCANINHRPYDLALLRSERDYEAASAGARITVIRILEREIKRQERKGSSQ